MDLGDLSLVSFSTLKDLEFQGCTTSLQVRDKLSQHLHNIKVKLLISQQMQRDLAEQLRMAEVARQRLGLGFSNIANHPCVVRLSVLTTTHHLMRRYQLVLLRDTMRLKRSLGMDVSPRLMETWYRKVVQLRRESPNIHNLFLWSLDQRHSNDEDANMLPMTRFIPWRPVE